MRKIQKVINMIEINPCSIKELERHTKNPSSCIAKIKKRGFDVVSSINDDGYRTYYIKPKDVEQRVNTSKRKFDWTSFFIGLVSAMVGFGVARIV